MSHCAHLGGLLCGLFPSFLILPNFKSERWEAALPVLGLAAMFVVFVFFPTYIYEVHLPAVCCRGWGDEGCD